MKKYLVLALSLGSFLTAAYAQSGNYRPKPVDIPTRWTKLVSPSNALPEYPRPQMVRSNWISLNGLWKYAITTSNAHQPAVFEGNILVPYSVESALSGVQRRLEPDQLLWYKRNFLKPGVKPGERVILHFGAVDWQANVFINGKEIGAHTGGYQNFSFDITSELKAGNNDLKVKVADPTDKGPNPHGKQSLNPSGIWYTPSSGIWQTVWLEVVPKVAVESLKVTPDVDKERVRIAVKFTGNPAGYTLKAVAKLGDQIVAEQVINANAELKIPNPHLWSPEDPFLYDLIVQVQKSGKITDEIKSYFGMRKIEVKKDEKGAERIFLNNKYTYNLGTLDQGFWPDGLYTAPTDEALAFDIKAIKAMGFNTIRKHIKIEPERWYYHCDKLGMLVWQDMVNPANDSPVARAEFEKESLQDIAQLYNHPSIVTWVVFNEGWGAYDQGRITKMVKHADPSRIVNGHSGENMPQSFYVKPDSLKWINSDLTDIHHYPEPLMPDHQAGKARVLGEFGGIAVPVEGHSWNDVAGSFGYGNAVNPPKMAAQYRAMVKTLKELQSESLSGSIYTQPFDVEGEQNGLMTYDRAVVKLPITELRKMNALLWPATGEQDISGVSVADTIDIDNQYADRLKSFQQGRTDSLFLRRLAIMASRKKDKENAREISVAYIKAIKDPFMPANLRFIRQFTQSSTDRGFSIFYNNRQRINALLGPNESEKLIKRIINAEDIHPYTRGKAVEPDWKALETKVITKYGDIGRDAIWMEEILYAANKTKEWGKAVIKLTRWMEKYGQQANAGVLNGVSWGCFENVRDRDTLAKALALSKRSVELDRNQFFMDTYANLLYRLGRKKEAIRWEEKALATDPFTDDFKNHLEKMRTDKPTWVVK